MNLPAGTLVVIALVGVGYGRGAYIGSNAQGITISTPGDNNTVKATFYPWAMVARVTWEKETTS